MNINERISHERKILEDMIIENIAYNKILKQSQKLDKLIAKILH